MNITRRQFLKYAAPLLLSATGYPVFIERYMVFENTYRIALPGLPEAFAGFRIVHLTDLHYGFLTPHSFYKALIKRVNSIPRDIIVCTGDLVQGSKAAHNMDKIWSVLATLNAPYGVYSVAGNHDHWTDADRMFKWMDETGQNLRGNVRPIRKNGQSLWIAGAGDLWKDHIPFDRILKKIPEKEFRILLAHNPDSADTPYSRRLDLMLSGHTHGGQVRLPFFGPLKLPVRNPNYSSGLKYSPKGCPVFISRGIGASILPVRLNCPPEIAILELQPADGAPSSPSSPGSSQTV